MASAHEQWMACMSKVMMLSDDKLQGKLLRKLDEADQLIDEENSGSMIREGLQIVRDIHEEIAAVANL